MKNPDLSPTPAAQTATLQAGVEACARLWKAINTLPIPDLRSIIEKNYGYKQGDHAAFRLDADDAIGGLVNLAELGDRDAVDHLVYLGCWIADVLASLQGRRSNKKAKAAASSIQTTPEAGTATWPYGSGEGQPKIRDEFDILAALTPDESGGIQRDLEKKHPGESAVVFLNNLADFPERMSAGKPAPAEFHQVEAIVQKLVGIRLNRHAKEVARGCAKASLYWPIVVHAFADGRSARTEAYVKLLNLGSVTGPVIDKGGGRGSTRKLVPDSRSGFALYVFEKLDRERIRAGGRCVYPTSDDEPASTDESISMAAGLEKPDESSQGLSDRRDVAWPSVSTVQLISMAARLGKTEVSSPGLSGWRDAAAASESNIKWISMAARLKMLDQSSEGLTRWHDAAMAYCDHLCSGNYAGFDWPTSVHERSRRRYKVPVSSVVKKTLSEILYSGFEALVATTKAVESPAPGQTGDVKGESAIQSATVSVIS